MTRQRLRESSVKWETNLSLESFALKIIKKSEMLSFTDKVKSIDVHVPEKVKIYINKILNKEINYFESKFKIKINFIADPQLIIPEYSLNLFDKNKKLINKIENINKIEGFEKLTEEKTNEVKNLTKDENNKKSVLVKKKNNEKKEKKKSPRTLWVRRKKPS